MNDLMPNDLSHLSDEEFNSLCPQGFHAPESELTSSAAQAVMDAYFKSPVDNKLSVAAALRAAALYCKQDRRILMTIADELDSLAQLQRQ